MLANAGQLILSRFDVIKYRDSTVQDRARADENADRPDFLLGCIMLVFRIRHEHFGEDEFRDFVLIRRMKTANRRADGPFPRVACEHKCEPPPGACDGDHRDNWWGDPQAMQEQARPAVDVG